MIWTALFSLALAQDPSVLEAEAEYIDIEPTSVGLEVPFTVSFTHSGGSGPVTVSAIDLVNNLGTAFTFDGAPSLEVPEGGTGELALLYRPTTDGRHLAELSIQSDADCVAPQVVTLRASAFEPCIVANPRVVDFGDVPNGQTEVVLVELQSCDGRTHTVDTTFASNSRFTLAAQSSFDITPTPSTLTLQFVPIDDSPQGGTLTLGAWESEILLTANDCYAGNPANFDSDGDGTSDCGIPTGGQWDDADGDGFSVIDGDCNDTDPAINPGADELDGGTDENCDGQNDEHLDRDEDSSKVPEDCDDEQAWMALGEPEVFDGLDNDCDGSVDESVEADTCADLGGGDDESKGCGCDTGPGPAPGAALVMLGLLGLRRRR